MNLKVSITLGIILFINTANAQEKSNPNSQNVTMKQENILGLRTTIYKVSNIEVAKDWYAKAFKTEPYFDESFYVGFNIAGYELGLQPEEGETGKKIETVVSYWGVKNVQEFYDHLLKLGAMENEKPYSPGGEMITATVTDPFGNVIGIIYNPYFKLPE